MTKKIMAKTGNNGKASNPFAEYQKKRQADTVEKVKGAISRIKQVKGKVSHPTVAKLAGRSEQCIRKNKDAALLVERAIAEQRGASPAVFDPSSTALPTPYTTHCGHLSQSATQNNIWL